VKPDAYHFAVLTELLAGDGRVAAAAARRVLVVAVVDDLLARPGTSLGDGYQRAADELGTTRATVARLYLEGKNLDH